MGSDSLQSCNKACADNAQCVAASYVGGKGTGHCYLKDKNNGASGSDSVNGGSQVRDSKTPLILSRFCY